MDLRDVLIVFHIAAAGTWLGANVVQAVVPGLAARQSAETAAGWFRITGQLSKTLYIPAAILILLSGVWLVLLDDSFGFGSIFVTIGFAMVVIGALLGSFVFGPGSERAAEAIESADESRIKSAVGRLARFGMVDTLLLLLTITAMVLRLD
jgi:hypothetical protein